MIKIEGLLGLVTFALWVFCLVEVISTRERHIRNMGKTLWVIVVLLFPLVGSIAWLVLGRPEKREPLTRAQGAAPAHPEYERRGRMVASDQAKDEQFLDQVRARAEEQRRRYAEEQRRKQNPEG